MILYFLRHGLAADREEWQGDDRLRPLIARGKQTTSLSAETMARIGLEVDLILTSPLTRAQQTAEIVAKKLHFDDRLQIDERLSPGFDSRKLADLLRDHARVERLMIVGHEPDFSETIGTLIGGGRLVCKKGGLARVDLITLDPPAGVLVWLLPPKILAAQE